MSIVIKRGQRWFRPMGINLQITLDNSVRADAFTEMLREQGFVEEAEALTVEIEQEQLDAKIHKTVGYICDPDERYKGECLQ